MEAAKNDQLDIGKYAWTDVTEMLFAANVMVRHVVLLGDSARTMQRDPVEKPRLVKESVSDYRGGSLGSKAPTLDE